MCALQASGEIGVAIRPGAYVPEIGKEFAERFAAGEWSAAALVDEMPDEYRRLHTDKVDVILRDMIVAKGAAKARGDWLHVPTSFAAHYMTYLANRIAERNALQMLSDSTPAWTGATYFRFNGEIEDYPGKDMPQQLAALVVRDFLPTNILAISPDDILSFREKYRDERQRFMAAIQRGATRLSECDDPTVAKDIIHDFQKDIESTLSDFRKSLGALNVVSMTGIKSLTFPVITKVATVIDGQELDPTTLMIVSAMGAALGVVSGLSGYREKRKKLNKECDYSYLTHLRREWKGVAMYKNDYNYYLYRQLEEFIND